MDKICPILKDKCIEHGCKFYIHMQGMNPQSGVTVDAFDCAIAWLPILMVENSNQTRQAAASIQSFRNEMMKQQNLMIKNNGKIQIDHDDAA